MDQPYKGSSNDKTDQRPDQNRGTAPGSSSSSTGSNTGANTSFSTGSNAGSNTGSGYRPNSGAPGSSAPRNSSSAYVPRQGGGNYQGNRSSTGGGYPARSTGAGNDAGATPDYSKGAPLATAPTGAARPGGFTGPRTGAGGYGGAGGFSGGTRPPYAGARPAFRPASSPSTPREAFQKEKDKDALRINAEIKLAEVRLVGADGEMVGVVPIKEALDAAEEAGLDLVEVSPQATPPVCKILDYGKYKYAEQKKKNEARKKQKIVEIKEVKLRPAIDEHDFQIKMAMSKRFLEDGDKVKITLRFRGRELGNLSLGDQLLEKVKVELENWAKVEQRTGMEGRQMIMILASIK